MASLSRYFGYNGQIAARYMVTPRIGIRPHYGFHHFYTTETSVGTFLRLHRWAVEGVYSFADLFPIRSYYEPRKYNVLLHAGGGFTHGHPSTLFRKPGYPGWKHEDIWSLMIGASPQYRLSPRLSAFADITMHMSLDQHYGYHGAYMYPGTPEAKTGYFLTFNIGLQLHLGTLNRPADWF